MKDNFFLNTTIGIGGTIAAFEINTDKAAIFAGIATGVWMTYQICISIYDRLKNKKIPRIARVK